jgi:hypothetical protein
MWFVGLLLPAPLLVARCANVKLVSGCWVVRQLLSSHCVVASEAGCRPQPTNTTLKRERHGSQVGKAESRQTCRQVEVYSYFACVADRTPPASQRCKRWCTCLSSFLWLRLLSNDISLAFWHALAELSCTVLFTKTCPECEKPVFRMDIVTPFFLIQG